MLGDMGIAPQRTLRSAASCHGIGLHCGRTVAMTLHPTAPRPFDLDSHVSRGIGFFSIH